MKRIVTLGMGQGGLWLAVAGQELPSGARVIPKEQARFWLRQSVPPMAHPTILHALSEIAEALGYPFHGAMAFDEVPRVLDWLEVEIKASRLVAFFGVSLEGGGKGPDAPPDEPSEDAPKKEKVNPVVEPVSLVLVVKKFAKNPATNAEEAYTDPQRQEITLKTDAAFDGTATFNCDKPDAVKFYSAKTGGVEIRLNGTDNVFPPGGSPPWAGGATISGGVKIYAEGIKPSSKKDDITISLSLSGGSKDNGPDDKATITSVEVTLDICKSRTAAQLGSAPPGEPDPLSKDDKVFAGRYLHKQDANHHGRAMVILRAVKPDDYAGDVELKVVGAVSLFEKDAPLPGAAAGADPAAKTTYKTADLKKKEAKMWAEATGVSAAPRDIEIQAGIKGVEPIADRCRITGVRFTQIKATIKPTPPNTPANSTAAGLPLPLPHDFVSTTTSDDFTATPPLVLLRNAQPDIVLEVTAQPANLPIRWGAYRNPDDDATIGSAAQKPTITPDGGNAYKANLAADQKGSFRVRPFIDCNGSSEWEDREPSIPLNLVLVDATMNADRSTATTISGPGPETITPGQFRLSTGDWAAAPFTASNREAMVMDCDVDLLGGGADGKLGLDKVFGGLVNMVQIRDVNALYTDTTTSPPTDRGLRFVAASNAASASSNWGTRKMFVPGDPAPVPFALPLLDTGKNPGGVGGDTATMSRSRTRLAPAQPALGQRMTIWCIDSPGWGFPKAHPVNGSAILRGVQYNYQFIANFVLWTNAGAGPNNQVAERTYSVIRIVPWQIQSAYTVDFTTNPAAPTFTAVTPLTVTQGASAARTISPVGRAQDNGVEVRPPSGITGAIVADATYVSQPSAGCSVAPGPGEWSLILPAALVAGAVALAARRRRAVSLPRGKAARSLA